MAEEIQYIEVRIHEKSGKITTHASNKEQYESKFGQVYFRMNITRNQPPDNYQYDYFITTNKRFRKDCAKHFGAMLKELDKEQAPLDKKRASINKLINNAKNL